MKELLAKQGYTRIHRKEGSRLEVDPGPDHAQRGEQGPARGGPRGRAEIRPGQGHRPRPGRRRESRRRSCGSPPTCTAPSATSTTTIPSPNLFSFNSPAGRLPDLPGLRPDHRHRLGPRHSRRHEEPRRRRGAAVADGELQGGAGGAPEVSPASAGCPLDVPWRDLTAEQRAWVIEGEGDWDDGVWFGAKRFFGGWSPRATGCTSGCSSPSTAPTRRAPPAAARG